MNNSANTEEQQVGKYEAEALPLKEPPGEKVEHHKVHHKGAEHDVAVADVSIEREILINRICPDESVIS